MTFTNVSFETGDATPTPPAGGGSVATGWAVTYVSTGTAHANFGDATVTEAAERFERNWSSNQSFLADFSNPATLTVATFNAAGPYAATAEGFEALWSSNESAHSDLTRLEQLDFGATLLGAEGFEREWSTNETFMFAFADTDLTPAPAGPEDFEVNWHTNQSALTSFAPGNLSAASFDGTSPQLYENFEEVDLAALWLVYVSVVVTAGTYSVTVENAVAKFVATGSESPAAICTALQIAVNNLGEHYAAVPGDAPSNFRLQLRQDAATDPTLSLADMLSGAGQIKVDSPNGTQLVLQRVDATTLWTQSGKLFTI